MSANPEPLVSVIIPNYNYARFLTQSIDSVLAQTYANVEVIVVDDGSTDDSVEVLRSYGDRIRWFQQPNRGVSAARNRGIQESCGSLIALLDADDVWEPNKLERQTAKFGDAGVGMVYSGVRYIDVGGASLGTRTAGVRGHVLQELSLLRSPGVCAIGSSALIKKECLNRVGLFDTDLSTSADWDMSRRIACHYSIEMVPEPLVRYRLHSSAMHQNVERFEGDMLRAFSRMFADPSAAALLPLRRRCYSRLYLTLSGSYLHARRWDRCIEYGLKSLCVWPASLAHFVRFLCRRMVHYGNPRARGLEPTP